MLLSLETLVWYGPGAASFAVGDGAGVGSAQMTPHKLIKPSVAVQGTGLATFRPYRGRAFALSAAGMGNALTLIPHKRARFGLKVSVNSLSQDDVTGAVLDVPVEGTITLRQAMRLLLAYAGGNATGLDSNPAFKSLDGSKTRLAGTISAGARTITTRDAL